MRILLLSAIACATFAGLFLAVEAQWEIGALLALGAGAVAIAAKAGLLRKLESAAQRHERAHFWLVLAVPLTLCAALYDNHFALLMVATVLLYGVACMGLNIQFGYAGVVNFAGAAFFGVGGYSAAVLATHSGLPHLLVIAVGGVIAAAIGSLLILPVLRTKGHYAALITIAFGVLFKTFLEVNETLGGPQGLKVPGLTLFGWAFNDNIVLGELEISFYVNYVLLALVLVGCTLALTQRLERSWIGLNLDAVRLDEIAAASFGINVARWKITAFVLGNFLAGIAGAVFAMMLGFIAPNNFTLADSLILVSIILLGGLGNAWGALLAAAVVLVLPEKLQVIEEYRFLLFAVLVILMLLLRPQGMIPRKPRHYFGRELA